VISVSGKPGTDYWAYLRSVDALLSEFSARVHWGKLHFLTPERLHALYPEAGAFIEKRRELDPAGMFLNEHLRELFA
jgi:FAD/FMN-containing dehydrogenase